MRGELFSSEMKIAQDFEVNTERKEKTMKELEKTYNPSAIEEKLYQKWLDNAVAAWYRPRSHCN